MKPIDSYSKQLLKMLEQIEEENLYIKKNIEAYSQLDKAEILLIELKARYYSDELIAKTLKTTVDSLDEGLTNIKKKLGFTTDSDIIKFARIFKIT